MEIQTKKAIKIILFFLVTHIVILIYGKYFMDPGDAMGYSLLFFFLITPLFAFIGSFLIGKRKTKLKWAAPILFSGVATYIPIVVFNSTGALQGTLTLVASIVGLLLGVIIFHSKKKIN